MILAAAAIAMPSQAQKKVNLNKGDVKVETVELNDGDYIAMAVLRACPHSVRWRSRTLPQQRTASSTPSSQKTKTSLATRW